MALLSLTDCCQVRHTPSGKIRQFVVLLLHLHKNKTSMSWTARQYKVVRNDISLKNKRSDDISIALLGSILAVISQKKFRSVHVKSILVDKIFEKKMLSKKIPRLIFGFYHTCFTVYLMNHIKPFTIFYQLFKAF